MTDEKSVDRRIIHGVLMAVFSRGALIRGASGTGKSELALELISRGHRLVADDAVRITRRGDELFGGAPELTAGMLGLDALGLVSVADVFGEEALQTEVKVDLCIDLTRESKEGYPDLLSDIRPVEEFFGVQVPLVRLDVTRRPASPVIIETAVKMLDHPSTRVARRLAAKHDSSIIRSSSIPQ
jgi:HPr kinase/phosphorylase